MPALPDFHYHCSSCSAEYPPTAEIYVCETCGGNLEVSLDLESLSGALDREKLRQSRQESLWRYAPLLPVSPTHGVSTPIRAAGWTPVYRTPALEQRLGLDMLYIKDEGRNPTASFKDRASAVVVARALDLGVETIVTASSGNAGAALAGMAAAVGMDAVILVPRSAPLAKIAQLRVYGARVLLVDGTYDDAFDLSQAASKAWSWYCRNTGYNPFTLEGKKTAAYEIWEQLGGRLNNFAAGLNVFVSVGDGNIISGIHKGFKELLALGWIEAMPRLFGVQAEGSAAVANAFSTGTETISPVEAKTLADSISVGFPRDGLRALRAAKETGGAYLTVSDDAILDAIPALGSAGIFAEPAGAASFAGVRKAVESGLISRVDPVLALNTGNGLKDVGAAMQAAGQAPVIKADLQSMRAVLEEHYRR